MKNEAVGKMDTPFSYSHFLSMFTLFIDNIYLLGLLTYIDIV